MFGLKEIEIKEINNVFKKYLEIDEVIIYGPRSTDNYNKGSNIDLAIKGDGLDVTLIFKIEQELENLFLPYFIDLSDLKKIDSKSLIEHIKKDGKTFYQKN